MRVPRLVALALTAALLAVPAAQAQTSCSQASSASFNSTACTSASTVAATVPYLASITNSLASVPVTATVAELNAGTSAAITGPTITVKSNFVYALTAQSNGFAANGAYTKAKGDLSVSTTSGGTYTAFTTSAVSLAAAQAVTNGRDHTVFFKLAYSWLLDIPGAYSTTVTFTVTAP